MNQQEIQTRITETRAQIVREKRRLFAWSNGRLISALVAVAGVAFGVQNHFWLGYALAVLAVVVFSILVHRFNEQKKVIELTENRLQVLLRYEARSEGKWHDFAENGAEYLTKEDFLANDLDLFGQHSLFQYINVCHTVSGFDALKRLLTKPNIKHIGARQDSVLELLRDDALAVDFEALGMTKDWRNVEEERAAESKLRSYATGEGNKSVPMLKVLAYGMPILALAAIVGAVVGLVSWVMVIYVIFMEILASVFLSGSIQLEKESVLVLSRRMDRLEGRLNALLAPDFQSAYLRQMQQTLANAPEGIRRLTRIAELWQMRENFVLYFPLVGVLAWDFNCCLALDNWRRRYGESFGLWLDWIGEVEALYSLGTLSRVRPQETTVPEIVESSTPVLEMADGKHPLLDPHTVVGNDYAQGGSTVIITGSNMSGKSTFMRTIALNAVLAYAGGTVMARAFRVSPMRIFTSMRVRDDVSEGISSFYGEVLRIKTMVEYAANERPMLVLVDEIFKGTNSADRIIGAEAAIRKLSRPWILTLVTTHDFELCALANSPQVQGKNYHFEEHYEGDALVFDYKIRPGRCQTTNAKHLMRLAGLLDDEAEPEKKEEAHVL